MDYHGLSWIMMDYHGLSWIIIDYHGLSWIIMDYHGLGGTIPWGGANLHFLALVIAQSTINISFGAFLYLSGLQKAR